MLYYSSIVQRRHDALKNAAPELMKDPMHGDLTLPPDTVVMKPMFKKDLVKFYLGSLQPKHTILDLNAGYAGMYQDGALSHLHYVALEQDSAVRAHLEAAGVETNDWNGVQIPLADASVDYVLCMPFIEHLPTYIHALRLLAEVRRVLRPGGRILIVVPNYLRLKHVFFEDYKHSWVTTKKRMKDMLADSGYEVLSTRYTIGWITMRMNPLTALLRGICSSIIMVLRLNVVERFLETIKLDGFGTKIKKTIFELIAIEAQAPVEGDQTA